MLGISCSCHILHNGCVPEKPGNTVYTDCKLLKVKHILAIGVCNVE